MKNVFGDTGYFIALVNKKDRYHLQAKEWAAKITRQKISCHISIPVVFEIADGFSKIGHRELSIDLLEKISNSTNFIVHSFLATQCIIMPKNSMLPEKTKNGA